MIGRVEEIARPRDFIVRDIEICKTQIVVTRDLDGKINAFHNVCSHRTNKVVLEARGSAPAFACSYHKWVFGLDGSLRGVPDADGFIGLDKSKCGLQKVACETWNGFIFVNLEREPNVTLKEFLGAFGETWDGLYLPFVDNPVIIVADLECNWKAIADGFSEAYHGAAIHPNTIGGVFLTKDNPFGRPHDMQFRGPHHWAVISGNPDYTLPEAFQIERLVSSGGISTTGNSFGGESQNEIDRMLAHPAINGSGANPWINELTGIFPNFHIDLSPGGFWTHQFWPVSPSRTRWESKWYIANATDLRTRFQQEHYVAKLSEIMLEDVGNVERVQQGIESRVKPFMELGDPEALIRHTLFHLDKWINAASAAEALAD
uniref:Putative dioxygenase n=1 Tax=Sphingomonas sp. JE1 TaxID=1628059 RepID=A0A0D4ZZY0_9SPHN|nr:putative dioxygenase [Sphingomonas sp. JE1]